jgi:hypothetical protein
LDPVGAQTVQDSGLRIFCPDDRVTPLMSSLRHELRFRRDHRWSPRHMSAYLDQDLSARGRARLERHTAECLDCRGVLGDLRQMLALLRGVTAPVPVADGPATATAVLRRLHEPASR